MTLNACDQASGTLGDPFLPPSFIVSSGESQILRKDREKAKELLAFLWSWACPNPFSDCVDLSPYGNYVARRAASCWVVGVSRKIARGGMR